MRSEVKSCDMKWCDVKWCDVIWSDLMWCEVMWCDMKWCDMMWSDLTWREVIWWMWCEVKWSDVMWCDVMWCDVKWSNVMHVMRDVLWCDVNWCEMLHVMWCDVLCCSLIVRASNSVHPSRSPARLLARWSFGNVYDNKCVMPSLTKHTLFRFNSIFSSPLVPDPPQPISSFPLGCLLDWSRRWVPYQRIQGLLWYGD